MNLRVERRRERKKESILPYYVLPEKRFERPGRENAGLEARGVAENCTVYNRSLNHGLVNSNWLAGWPRCHAKKSHQPLAYTYISVLMPLLHWSHVSIHEHGARKGHTLTSARTEEVEKTSAMYQSTPHRTPAKLQLAASPPGQKCHAVCRGNVEESTLPSAVVVGRVSRRWKSRVCRHEGERVWGSVVIMRSFVCVARLWVS